MLTRANANLIYSDILVYVFIRYFYVFRCMFTSDTMGNQRHKDPKFDENDGDRALASRIDRHKDGRTDKETDKQNETEKQHHR